MFGIYKEIIDLTLSVKTNMEVPPANKKTIPPVELRNYRIHEDNGIHIGFYQTGIHAGTHIDAPLHIIPGGKTIDQLDLSYFLGEAYCIDCSEVKPNEPVTAKMLNAAADSIKSGMIVFLYTGWSDKMFGNEKYWSDSPYLGEDAARWLVKMKVKIAGYDFFQEIGAKQVELNPELFVVHKILLGNGILNIEHLTNLGQVVGTNFFCVALPLKLVGAEGSPTRVVALR